MLTIETMLEQLNTLQDDLQSELQQLQASATAHTTTATGACSRLLPSPRLLARAAMHKWQLNVMLLKQRWPSAALLACKRRVGDFLRVKRPVWMFACGSAALLGMSVWRRWSQI